MVYWKVLRRNYHSAIANGKAAVKYEYGAWVQAPKWLRDKGYYLFVFCDRKSAEDFGERQKERIIVKALVKGKQKILPTFCSFWGLENGNLFPFSDTWPRGTVMVKKVMIVRGRGGNGKRRKDENKGKQ